MPAPVSKPGMRPDTGIVAVVMLLLPTSWTARRRGLSRNTMIPVAIPLSMIVLITSLTPRQALRAPAIAAQAAPTTTATRIVSPTWSGAGRTTAPPTTAAKNTASRYCPSMPMLNSSIRKPMAAAIPAR